MPSPFLCFFSANAQNIAGKYCLKKADKSTGNYSVFEIIIENDSTFTSSYFSSSDSNFKKYTTWHVEKTGGKIRHKTANKYLFFQYDKVVNKLSEIPVKVTKRKLVFYAFKNIRDKELAKGFEMAACL